MVLASDIEKQVIFDNAYFFLLFFQFTKQIYYKK